MTLFTRDSFGRMGGYHTNPASGEGPRVKIHRNAKATPSMRALIVERVRRDRGAWRTPPRRPELRAARRPNGWRAIASAALADRSSRPHESPRRTPAQLTAAIGALLF